MYTITRTPTGIKARAIPGHLLEKEVFDTFSYAVGGYSHVLEFFREYTGDQWIAEIERTYAPSERVHRVVEAIKQAMQTHNRTLYFYRIGKVTNGDNCFYHLTYNLTGKMLDRMFASEEEALAYAKENHLLIKTSYC